MSRLAVPRCACGRQLCLFGAHRSRCKSELQSRHIDVKHTDIQSAFDMLECEWSE